MKTGFSLLLFLALSHYSWSQLTEQFTDGDFTANPAWSGTGSSFIVNAAKELQTSNTVAATSYLATPHGLSSLDDQEWRVRVNITTAPSSGNYGRVFLTATNSDLTLADGFFLQFGETGSADAVHLRKLVSGVETTICSGPAAQIAASFNIGVRVVRSATGQWSLFTDAAGGINYTLQATGTDAANLSGTYFGILAVYTASNATKYHFDDVYAGPEIVDTQAPSIVSVTAVADQQVTVLFDEPVSGAAAATASNYSFNPAVSVSAATIDGTDAALVHLSLSGSLSNGQAYMLTVASINDPAGNTATGLTSGFTYLVNETAEKGDLIITEFMCDPSPAIGLPELEFVEVHNVSSKFFNLAGWKLGDASSSGTITSGWISPGEYKILCATSSVTGGFPTGFPVTSFPSLNNSGDAIVLKAPSLLLIDSLSYTDSWYHDAIKKEGGYTIELINPNHPCSGSSNWTASNDQLGGTPGAQNSVYANSPDTQVPALAGSLAIAPDMLRLSFSEGMDSSQLVNALFSTDPALAVSSVSVLTAFTDTVLITFSQPIASSQLYSFTYGPVSDCWLNATTISGNFALASLPETGDLKINEILFDPGTGGTDFVEVYNNSNKVLDLTNYQLANFDDDTIANIKTISEHRLLFPGEYVVFTADSNFQKMQFPEAVEGTFCQLALPPLNNDSSTIFILYNGIIIDKVSYREDWHLSLIDDTENKTLERIDPNGPSTSPSNWHTAAETIGFGTPGKQNSHYQQGGVNGDFGTVNPIFSPDNDGFEDVLQFYYTMPQPGMIATVNIYDDQGRLIRELTKSELLALLGTFTWNGINDKDALAQPGIYLAVIEAFTTDSKANFSKRIAFTLAGKLD